MKGADVHKPDDLRCEFCLPDSDCDLVALNLGWCGLARLSAAVNAVKVHPLGDSDNGPSLGGPHVSNGGDQ